MDGDLSQGGLFGGVFAHTLLNEDHQWWRVDLGQIYHVYKVIMYNRGLGSE